MGLLLRPSASWYVPDRLDEIPPEVRDSLPVRFDLLGDCLESYPWHNSTFDGHLAQVRENTGSEVANTADKEALESWLRQHGAYQAHVDELLLWNGLWAPHFDGFYQHVHRRVADRRHQDRIDESLTLKKRAPVTPS